MANPFAAKDNHHNVNFIKHLRAAHERLVEDDRCTAQHISLYMALFMSWNNRRFRIPMSIVREDVMQDARIGSVHTYTRCIRELMEWDYLRYDPSFNSRRGTKIYMYRFDKADDKAHDKANDPTFDTAVEEGIDSRVESDKGADHASDQTDGQATDTAPARPLLNMYLNKKNNVKDENIYNASNGTGRDMYVDPREVVEIQEDDQVVDKDDDLNPYYDEETTGEGVLPRSLSEVKDFFRSKKYSLRDAELFYMYYCSIGWRVGKAGVPVENWRAVAYTWILRSDQFTDFKF
jgi:hypothetical protein